jgi:hypothetical protein
MTTCQRPIAAREVSSASTLSMEARAVGSLTDAVRCRPCAAAARYPSIVPAASEGNCTPVDVTTGLHQ